MKTYLPVYGLVTALLLAACGSAPQPTDPTQPPADGAINPAQPSTLGSLYQVNFQGMGDDTPSVTTQSLTAGVQGQALVNTPTTQLTLGSDPLFISSFTNRNTNVRHIQATFKVTNTGSTPLDNLVFLPTVTTDTDNDPSNNATTPTIAGTPFRTVEYFDGSDASSRATSLTLGHGQLLNAASGAVTDDPDASPFLTGLDVGGIAPVPPTGLSASVTNTGWQVSPSLAPGQSANVTFAVDEQNADVNHPKNDPYRFSLLVAAAQSDAASAAGTINPSVLRGTVADSALFGGKVVLVNGVSFPSTQFGAAATVGAAGDINLALGVPPSGDFTAALPPQGDPCTYSGTVSDSSARIAEYAGLLASSSQGDPVATIQEAVVSGAKVPGAIVSRVYVNAPLVLKAKVSCSNRPYTIDYDVTLNQGWNAVEISGNNSASVMKNLSPDARSALKVTRRTPGVTVSLDDSSVINLTPGERVTRNVYFSQVGAYSGTVNLSTNVPGVSVEPASVTLGSLTAQSVKSEGWTAGLSGDIKAQSLSTPITFVAAADAPTHNSSYNDALIISEAGGKQIASVQSIISLVIPSMSASINNSFYPVSLGQGEQHTVNISLTGYNRFDSLVTVSLDGLPDGVTVIPQTVRLTSENTKIVTLTVNASDNARLGYGSMKLVTSFPNISIDNLQSKLIVFPKRIKVDGSFFKLYAANSGVWAVTSIPYVDATPVEASRYTNGIKQNQISQVFPLYRGADFFKNASGLLISKYATPILIDNQHSTTINYTDDNGISYSHIVLNTLTDATSQFNPAVFDYTGAMWFFHDFGDPNNADLRLARFDHNGTETVFDQDPLYKELYFKYNASMNINSNGTFIVINSGNSFIQIDTKTYRTKSFSFPKSDSYKITVMNDGTIWLGSLNSLDHVSSDGKIIKSVSTSYNLIGEDRHNPNIIWATDSDSIIKLDSVANIIDSYYIGNYNDYSLNSLGGIDLLNRIYNYSIYPYESSFYLTHLD